MLCSTPEGSLIYFTVDNSLEIKILRTTLKVHLTILEHAERHQTGMDGSSVTTSTALKNITNFLYEGELL